MRKIGVLGGDKKFLDILSELMTKGKLCVQEIYVYETSYKLEKRAYVYIYPIKVYLALTCPYLGFQPTEHRESFKPYCADKNNEDMNPEYCMKLWKGRIPYILHRIYEERGKPEKKQREDMVYIGGRWIPKAEAKMWGWI